MKNVLIIDSTLPSIHHSLEFILNSLINDQNSADILFNKLKGIPDEKYLLIPSTDSSELNKIIEISNQYGITTVKALSEIHNTADLLKELSSWIQDKDIDNICLLYVDSPLLSISMLKKLEKLHIDNIAEYTFGDNFAEGLVPEFMSKEFLMKIREYKHKKPDILSRKVFDCLDADINKFFIELEIAEYDFSMLRIELTASSKRNYTLLKKLVNYISPEDDINKIYESIKAHPEILFIFPKYIEIELTNKNNLDCIIRPKKKLTRKEEELDIKHFKKVIDELTAEYQDIIISFSLSGEPLLHPHFLEFIEYALSEGKVFNVIIETNGLLLNPAFINELSRYPLEKLIVIFKLNSLNPETYQKLYSGSSLDEMNLIKKNILAFLSFNEHNKFRTFIEIHKVKENNTELEDFYNFWQNQGVNVIIQKYNSYSGLLEDRSVVDLTPLDRIPCWHLQRDLEIFASGDVPLCKQDINGKNIIGNIKQKSIKQIWQDLEKYYKYNFQEDYKHISSCRDCNEWYTFNF